MKVTRMEWPDLMKRARDIRPIVKKEPYSETDRMLDHFFEHQKYNESKDYKRGYRDGYKMGEKNGYSDCESRYKYPDTNGQ